jgi:RimJ/RimL family protein N-acetyltransferase
MNLGSYPVEVGLREGTQATVRPMELKDGPGVLDFYRALPEEDRLFLRDDVTRPSWLERFTSQIDYNRLVPLIAEQGGKVVGNAALYRSLHGWSVHVGEIRVVVARALQGKGLGSLLVRELTRIAVDAGLEKMVASVVDNQVGAKRAFEKLGFKPEAVLKGHVKDIHGSKRDLVILANDVSHIWESMESLLQDFSPSLE